MKKLIVSICTLAVSAIMLCSSTYAWFSMNKTVTASGMKVTAGVDSNLFIAEKNSTWKENDSAFTTAVSLTSAATNLAPVSTIDGKNFFYIDSTNVTGQGSAKTATYLAYDETEFKNAYNNAAPYVEYTFILKAQNTSSTSAQNILLNKLELKYNGETDGNKAYRVALIYKKVDTAEENGAKTDPEVGNYPSGTSVKLYAPESVEHFTTDKAVSATNAVDTVTYVKDKEAMASIDKNKTEYYDVIVRLWLEGEDKTCNVEKFKALTDNWELLVGFGLATDTEDAVVNLAMSVTTKV